MAAPAPAALDPDRTAFAAITSPDPGHQKDLFLVRAQAVDLGRTSKDDPPSKCPLGDNMGISRQHARIAWDAAAGAWALTVQGKNGVCVNNGTLLRPESAPWPLASGDALAIADRLLVWRGPAPGWPVLGGDGKVLVAGGDGRGGVEREMEHCMGET